MPVIAKQNQLDQLYEYQLQQAAADFAVYDTTVTNSVHQRLLLFRAHHHKCASRRRNALANEMRQESRRADWLRRKYVDSVRQQQTHQQQVASSRLNQTTTATATGGEATTNGMAAASKGGGGMESGMQECGQHSEFTDVKPFTNGISGTPAKTAGRPISAENTATTTEVHGPAASATPVETDTTVFIKREPDTLDYLSSTSPCRESRDLVAVAADFAAIKSDSEGHKRRLSFSLKTDPSKWGSLCTSERDTRDDLKLTAYDVIAGVISTPPIKPLEPEGENSTTKLKPLAGLTTGISTPTTTTTTLQQLVTNRPITTPTTGLPKASNEQHYLVHELDEFSKIMDEVTQEQTAMELAAAETVYSEHSHESSLVSPYLSIPPSCPPREISVPNNSFYQQKYSQVQAAQSQSQIVQQEYHHHQRQQQQQQHHHQQQQHSASVSAECKSPLLLSGGGIPGRLSILSDVPSSSSSSSCSQPLPSTPTTPLEHFSSSQPVPPTPTTPLEHFSSFSSPPQSHLASSAAVYTGTSHLSLHSGISHLPLHPSTSHLPSHPSTSHLPSHPSNTHISPHPGNTTLISPHPGNPTHVSPHPGNPTHVSPHQCSPQQVVCQPYPSIPPHPFPYNNHPPDTNSYQSSGSVGDSWSLPTHRQQPSQVIGGSQGGRPQITAASSSQGSLKDSILARVSSRVVAIAGQKRPPMLDLSGVPSSRMKGGGSMLDRCGVSAGGGPPPQYSSVTHHTHTPYETSTTPLSLSSVSFPSPRQHL